MRNQKTYAALLGDSIAPGDQVYFAAWPRGAGRERGG